MNDQEHSKRDELRESWIDSLLTSATKPQDHSQRIARAMDRIEADQRTARPKPAKQFRSRRMLWSTMGVVAAVLLLAFQLFPNGGEQTAIAAVQRSLDVAAERTIRHYWLEVNYQAAGGQTRTTRNDLYVEGNDRFALRYPALLPGTSLWLGQDGDEAWVLPAFGPVLKGDNTMLTRWLETRGQPATPYLHVTTVLNRMNSRGYRLKTVSNDESVAISDSASVACRHIRTERTATQEPGFPETIDLWAGHESGMAMRLVARWKSAEGVAGRESVVITFRKEETMLSEAWFTAESHYEGTRPTIRFDKWDDGAETETKTEINKKQ
jgi:hypothetical protein